MGFPKPALDGFQPGDERGRHRAHAGDQNAQFALGGRNLDVVLIGQYTFSLRSKCYNTNSMRDRATATLTTIVVDDEQLACDELSYLLKDFPEIEVIATGSNGLEARRADPETGAGTGLSGRPHARSGRPGRGAPAARKGRRAAAFHLRDGLRPVRRGGLPAGGHGLPAEAGGQGPAGGDHRARPAGHPGKEGAGSRRGSEPPQPGRAARAPSCWSAPTAATSSWTPTT